MCPCLYIVIPCYNEQEVLPITAPLFLEKINSLVRSGKISDDSRIMFVNDGSSDETWDIILSLSASNYHYIGICQSRNRGHQNAVLAGLMESKDKCDITISIDCDGQDDINAIDAMVDKYIEGNEIVYGVRYNRDSDTFFKRFTAESFYKLLEIMGVDVVFNHADYRLISSVVLEELSNYHEVNLFLRGLVPLVGYKSAIVEYERAERIAGESHYPLKKMISLAVEGITSLSVKPLSLIFIAGVFLIVGSVIGIICSIMHKGVNKSNLLMFEIICLLNSVQLLSTGILAEYVGKIYLETKKRPRYIISNRTWE